MDTIHIIPFYNILYNIADIVSVFLLARIKYKQSVIREYAAWLLYGNMISGKFRCRFGLCPKRIYPSMQFHPSFMTLFNHPFKRIPVRCWSRALFPCQESAPWLYLTVIQSVALRTNLKDNCIYTILFQFVKLIRQRLLHLLSSHSQELTVHALYPSSAELSFLSLGINVYIKESQQYNYMYI